MNQQSKTPTTPVSKKPTNSMWEIVLISGYFLAVVLIPASWVNTAIGAIAFGIASKVNPYLSEFSIAFAEDVNWFIHCNVLATLFFIPWGFILIVKRNGGIDGWRNVLAEHIGGGSLLLYALKVSLLLFPAIFGMLWLVEYPLSGASYAIWVGKIGVPISAAIPTYLISLYVGLLYTVASLFLKQKSGEHK